MVKRTYASVVSSFLLFISAAHCQSVQPRIAATTSLRLALTASPAQISSPNVNASKDEAEVQACTLTMDTITRMMQATEELILLKDNVEQRKDDQDYSKDEQSLDQQTAGLARRPELFAVLSKYGFTPRTYVVAFYAYLSAGVAAGELDARDSLASVNKAHLNAANIALVRAHKKEINELMQKYVYPHW